MPHCCLCKPGICVRQWSLLLSIGDLVLYNYVWISVHYYWDTSILYYMTVLVDQCSLLLRHVYLVLCDCTCRSVFTTTETRLSCIIWQCLENNVTILLSCNALLSDSRFNYCYYIDTMIFTVFYYICHCSTILCWEKFNSITIFLGIVLWSFSG